MEYKDYGPVYIQPGRYGNQRLALELYGEDGAELAGHCISKVTVNIPHEPLGAYEIFVMDWEAWSDLPRWLEQHGVAQRTGRLIRDSKGYDGTVMRLLWTDLEDETPLASEEAILSKEALMENLFKGARKL